MIFIESYNKHTLIAGAERSLYDGKHDADYCMHHVLMPVVISAA